ncbi:hypothetical protein ABFS83_01G070200 [Erythranthe nasuta]
MAGREEKSRDIMVAQSGYNIYSDVSSSTGNQNIPAQFMSHLPPPPTQQSFDPSTASTSAAEIYNLTAGMEMIGFPSKHHHQHTAENPGFWKGFFSSATKPTGNNNGGASSSSSKEITDDPTSADHFYQHQQNYSDAIQNHTPPSSSSWNNIHHQNRFLSDDGGGGGGAVFPCEGNERPSQGLSLSLSSSNPSTIQLQSFQLIRNQQQQQQQQNQNQHVINMQSDVLMHHHHQHVIDNIHNHQSHAVITNSKYLLPTQELLYEFCSLQTNEIDHKSKPPKPTDSSLVDEAAIKTLDLLDLQRRKAKLLQMLEEVDRRYKRYCDQMKAVISSFESTAGNGSARVYSSLASRAMSRHFRCLRDGIVSQIKAAKKAMGDKDVSAPGSVKGETPRLRLLDQTLRQQRAMQQMSLMESHPWRPQRGLPERSVSVLRAWLFEHFLHPYPSDVDKHILARQTGLSRSQVSNWFINARVRLWKPMVEEMYLEELKEDEGVAGDGSGGGGGAAVYENDGLMSSQNRSRSEDLKPSHDQLVRMDSECLSSIINNNNNNNKNESKRNKGGGSAAAAAAVQNEQHHQINPSFGRVMGDSYGSAAMELDFSSYSHHSSGGGSAVHYGGGGGGVSLTLGLHQHGGGGVSLASFSPAAGTQNSMFYGGRSEQMVEDNQYTLLDGGENQNLPYRNLMGAQLLHDLAG